MTAYETSEAERATKLLMSFVGTAEARNKIRTREMAQHLIDRFEEVCDHEYLPPHYDWLVALRDSLPVAE